MKTPEGTKATFTLKGFHVASSSGLILILGFKPGSDEAVLIHMTNIGSTNTKMYELDLSDLEWDGLNGVAIKTQSNGWDTVHAIDNFKVTWDS